MITLRNLSIFLEVAETGSMSQAAKNLYMAQSSISQDIAELEKTYEVLLFERVNRRLKLTSTGEMLVRYARNVIAAAQETEDFLKHESSHPRLRIGATGTVGACVLSPLLRRLQDAVPGLVQDVSIENSEKIKEMLLKGEIDIALVEGTIEDSNLITKDVVRDRLVLICSSKHRFAKRDIVDIRELENEPLIISEKGSAVRGQMEKIFKNLGLKINISWGSYNIMPVIDAVRHNLGIGILTKRTTFKEAIGKSVHVCNIVGADVSCNYRLVYPKTKIFPKSLEEFIKICQELNVIAPLE